MKRIKATLLDRWTKITQTVRRQEPQGDWVRSDRDPLKPNVVTAAVSKRYGEQRVIADSDDRAVLDFIVAAKTAMPTLIDTVRLYEKALDDVWAIVLLRRELDEGTDAPLLAELERVLSILNSPDDVHARAKLARPRDRQPARARDAAARTSPSTNVS